MIKAVLLDLDNTLLRNPDRRWAAAFRDAWEAHFFRRCHVAGAWSALREAIACLNSDPPSYRSNAETIFQALARELPLPEAALAKAIEDFYAEPYRRLKAETAPIAGAPKLVQRLLEQNLLVAIATNPLFPEAATLERIAWAGLSDFTPAFTFVTHSENMRFAKPSPAYFAETVARVGVEPDETLLIGDSARNDIAPANAIGIHTWQVASENALQPLYAHVENQDWRNGYHARQLRSSMILPQYIGNVAALYGLLAEVKPHQWHLRPDPDEWSIMQILCHLWQAEREAHFARLKAILTADNPFLAAPAPPGPHIQPCHDDGSEILFCFRRAREDTIRLLERLEEADWERPARHSIFGLTTLLEMAHFTAQHDRLHITQLCQTLGKCAD